MSFEKFVRTAAAARTSADDANGSCVETNFRRKNCVKSAIREQQTPAAGVVARDPRPVVPTTGIPFYGRRGCCTCPIASRRRVRPPPSGGCVPRWLRANARARPAHNNQSTGDHGSEVFVLHRRFRFRVRDELRLGDRGQVFVRRHHGLRGFRFVRQRGRRRRGRAGQAEETPPEENERTESDSGEIIAC